MPFVTRRPALPDISVSASGNIRLRLWIEGDPDPLFLAPDNTAGHVRAIGDERELRGDSERARDIEGCAGGGEIADRAVDCTAAELDRSGLQDPMPGGYPVLIHWIGLLQESAKLTIIL